MGEAKRRKLAGDLESESKSLSAILMQGRPGWHPDVMQLSALNVPPFGHRKPDFGRYMAPKISRDRMVVLVGASASAISDYGSHREVHLTVYTNGHPYGMMATLATLQQREQIDELVSKLHPAGLAFAGLIHDKLLTGGNGEEYQVILGRLAESAASVERPSETECASLARHVSNPMMEAVSSPYPALVPPEYADWRPSELN